MITTNANQYIKYSQTAKSIEDNVILPIDHFGFPPVTISTLIVDADNEKAEGATISVVENNTNYSVAQADGMVYLEEVQPHHTIQVNYAGAKPLFFPATDVPTIIQFGSNMLDTVIINAPKKKSSWVPPVIIGLSLLGVFITVGQAMKEEKTLKVSL